MPKKFKELIFTKHALKRLKDRGISQSDTWYVWRKPDQTRRAKSKDAWIYYKVLEDQKIEVTAKQNQEKEWIVLSVWSKPIPETEQKKPLLARLKGFFFNKT